MSLFAHSQEFYLVHGVLQCSYGECKERVDEKKERNKKAPLCVYHAQEFEVHFITSLLNLCFQTKEGRQGVLKKGETCPIKACILKKRERQIVCLYHANVCKIKLIIQNYQIL